MGGQPPVGHRGVPHTADLRIEAWAPSRERCVAEAVTAMIGSFAEISEPESTTSVGFQVGPGADQDLLVAVLDEIIYRMDIDGRFPVGADVSAADGALEVRLRMADPDRVQLIGAVPKAVSLHELRFEQDEVGWSCAVTLDV